MCNIGVKHTRPTLFLVTYNNVCTPNNTELDASNPHIIIRISCTDGCFMNDGFDLIIVGFLDEGVPRGILCNNVTIAPTLKTLTTLGTLKRLIYHRFALRVLSCVSVWARLLPDFRDDPTL